MDNEIKNQNVQVEPVNESKIFDETYDMFAGDGSEDHLVGEEFEPQLREFENTLNELVNEGVLEVVYNDDGEQMYQHATTVDDEVYEED